MASLPRSTYKYQPLPSNDDNFRLLELLPSPYPTAPLHCNLHIFSLATPPNYDALSYVWRAVTASSSPYPHDDDTPTIHLADKTTTTLAITANLARALRGVRDPTLPRLLWADAICINQSDPRERSAQVQRMQAVFQNAAHVLVWLGDAVPSDGGLPFDAAQLFAFLDAVAARCPSTQAGALYRGRGGGHAGGGFEAALAPLDAFLRSAQPRIWEMLRALHEALLFHRIWIVQELNLATDGFLVATTTTTTSTKNQQQQQQHRLQLARFKTALFWIRKRRPLEVRRFHIPWEHLDPFLYLRFLVGDVSRPPASITGSSGAQPVYFVLRSIRHCAATDPRDMIYGLLGHSSLQGWTRGSDDKDEDEDEEQESSSDRKQFVRVPVDYTIPHEQVYLAVAQRLMQESQPLFTLSLVEHDNDQYASCCPSWVPRWDVKRQQYILADEYRDRYEKQRTKPASFAVRNDVVEIAGCVVDTIAWRSATMADLAQSTAPIHESWAYLVGLQQDKDDKEQRRRLLRSFALTLNAGCRVLSKQTFREDVSEDQRIADCRAVLSPDDDGGDWDWDRFLATTQDVCRGRCFFITSQGLLGLGPRVAAVGDAVCVFYGAQVPFVLSLSPSSSEKEEEHRLAGECYVHGIMHGEALNALDEGKLTHKVFCLV